LHAAPPPPIYPLSLHDALPIFGAEPEELSILGCVLPHPGDALVVELPCSLLLAEPPASHGQEEEVMGCPTQQRYGLLRPGRRLRSEEHTSELQSLTNLVCRLLL